MNSMYHIKWLVIKAISIRITVFVFLVKINSAEKMNQNLNTFQNEQNTSIPCTLINPDLLFSHSYHSPNKAIRSEITQNELFQFAAISSSHNHEYPNRYHRDSSFPPSPSFNSSNIVMIQTIINKFQEELSLLNATASLNDENKCRVGTMEVMIKEQKVILDNLVKQTLENYDKKNKQLREMGEKLKIAISNGVVQSILSRQFSFAEDQLRLYDYGNYENELKKDRNQTEVNFNPLLKFASSIQDFEIKFKVYEVLYNEMKTKIYKHVPILLKLSQYLRKDISEISTGTMADKYRSFNRTLEKKIPQAAIKLITTAFLKDTLSWEKVKESKEEIRRSLGLQFLTDVYSRVINKIKYASDIGDIFKKSQQNLNDAEEILIVHKFLIKKIEKNQLSGSDGYYWMQIARYIKATWDNPKFNDINFQTQYMYIINKLPKSLKNIVISPSVCIRNPYFDEYLYVAEPKNKTNGENKIFTGILPKNKTKSASNQFKWKASFQNDFGIAFLNIKYNEYLDYINSDSDSTSIRYDYEYKANAGTSASNSKSWTIQVEGDKVLIAEYAYILDLTLSLYADNKKKDGNRRDVFLKWRIGKQPHLWEWEFVNC